MKIRNILLPLFALSATAIIGGCGQYTNFPAQYHIAGTSDLVATVIGGAVKLPTLVLEGEPGSIGATFNQMDIKYSVGDISPVTLPVTVRVDSSGLKDSAGNVVVDGGSVTLPVVNQKVITYSRSSNATNISAVVTLSGTDDAAWPTSIDVNVPIVILPSATSGGTTPVTTP